MTVVITVQEPLAWTPEGRARGEGAVTVREATVTDSPDVLAMVGRCSQRSLFHRFHGFTDGLAYTRAALDPRRSDDVLVAASGSECVGLATLGRGPDGIAHLGVLVEDAWQRRGVGSRLVAEAVGTARVSGVSTLHADVLASDRFIVDLLGRLGAVTVDFGLGTFAVNVDLIRARIERPV